MWPNSLGKVMLGSQHLIRSPNKKQQLEQMLRIFTTAITLVINRKFKIHIEIWKYQPAYKQLRKKKKLSKNAFLIKLSENF